MSLRHVCARETNCISILEMCYNESTSIELILLETFVCFAELHEKHSYYQKSFANRAIKTECHISR